MIWLLLLNIYIKHWINITIVYKSRWSNSETYINMNIVEISECSKWIQLFWWIHEDKWENTWSAVENCELSWKVKYIANFNIQISL